MKGKLLLISLLAVAIALSGCVEVSNFSPTKDCGKDMPCFMERFKYCEKAKVEYQNKEQLGRGMNETYYTSEKTKAEIKQYNNAACEVNFTSIIVEGFDDKMNKTEETWNNAVCYFMTGEPNQKTVAYEPYLYSCSQLRE
jgi:hypothetical protein